MKIASKYLLPIFLLLLTNIAASEMRRSSCLLDFSFNFWPFNQAWTREEPIKALIPFVKIKPDSSKIKPEMCFAKKEQDNSVRNPTVTESKWMDELNRLTWMNVSDTVLLRIVALVLIGISILLHWQLIAVRRAMELFVNPSTSEEDVDINSNNEELTVSEVDSLPVEDVDINSNNEELTVSEVDSLPVEDVDINSNNEELTVSEVDSLPVEYVDINSNNEELTVPEVDSLPVFDDVSALISSTMIFEHLQKLVNEITPGDEDAQGDIINYFSRDFLLRLANRIARDQYMAENYKELLTVEKLIKFAKLDLKRARNFGQQNIHVIVHLESVDAVTHHDTRVTHHERHAVPD